MAENTTSEPGIRSWHHFVQLSGAGAAYLTNAFLIRLPPGLRLLDEDGQIPLAAVQPAGAGDFSVLVHEFVHFLHNFSTLAGFMSFSLYRDLVSVLGAANGGADWTCTGNAGLSQTQLDYAQDRIEQLRRLGGTVRSPFHQTPNSTLKVHAVHVDDSSGHFSPLIADLEVTDAGASQRETVHLGFGVLEEGIAWFIERTTASTLGASKACPDPPHYPYKVLEAVSRFWMPGVGSTLSIRTAILAMNTPQPWRNLLLWLRRIGDASDQESELAAITSEWRITFELALGMVRLALTELTRVYSQRGLAELGIRSTLNLCQRLFRWRYDEPFFELAFAQGERPWTDLFARVPPCEILLELETYDEKGLLASLRTFGGQSIRNDDDDVASRRVLHSQEHFVRLHVVDNGFRPTSEVEEAIARGAIRSQDAQCPYYDACDLSDRQANPTVCQKSPWRHAREHEHVCWYAHAVLATFAKFETWKRVG